MGLACILSRGQMGMDAYQVVVEVHVAGGLPAFTISGLPAAAVRESRDRVRAALQTCGKPVPPSRVTAHLGPADIPKEGGRFDLPIALGVLQEQNNWPWPTEDFEFIGELALSGALRPVRGALPAVVAARDAGRGLILPAENAAEAALVADARVYPRRTPHAGRRAPERHRRAAASGAVGTRRGVFVFRGPRRCARPQRG